MIIRKISLYIFCPHMLNFLGIEQNYYENAQYKKPVSYHDQKWQNQDKKSQNEKCHFPNKSKSPENCKHL